MLIIIHTSSTTWQRRLCVVWEGESQRTSKSKRTTTTMATGINGMNAIFLYFHFLIFCDTSFVCIYCRCCAPTTSMCSPIFSFVVQLLLHRSVVCNEVGMCIFSSAPSNKLQLWLCYSGGGCIIEPIYRRMLQLFKLHFAINPIRLTRSASHVELLFLYFLHHYHCLSRFVHLPRKFVFVWESIESLRNVFTGESKNVPWKSWILKKISWPSIWAPVALERESNFFFFRFATSARMRNNALHYPLVCTLCIHLLSVYEVLTQNVIAKEWNSGVTGRYTL